MACRTQVGASEEDVTRHMGFQDAISHAGKCLAACVEETLGIVIRISFYFHFIFLLHCTTKKTKILLLTSSWA